MYSGDVGPKPVGQNANDISASHHKKNAKCDKHYLPTTTNLCKKIGILIFESKLGKVHKYSISLAIR